MAVNWAVSCRYKGIWLPLSSGRIWITAFISSKADGTDRLAILQIQQPTGIMIHPALIAPFTAIQVCTPKDGCLEPTSLQYSGCFDNQCIHQSRADHCRCGTAVLIGSLERHCCIP